MSIEPKLDYLVEQAREGNEEALEAVVRAIQDRIYTLALRMLWHPSDAEDATQEILLKVITRLSQFRHESAFMTWVYQIAKNHLLTTRQRRAETNPLTFAFIGDELEAVEAQISQANYVLESKDCSSRRSCFVARLECCFALTESTDSPISWAKSLR